MRPFALVRFFKTFSLGPTPRRFRLGAGPEAFASKPRARFDCLEIELLMSSHSNFSRLPLSKIVEIDRGTAFHSAFSIAHSALRIARGARELVGVTGVEPVTFTLSV